MKSSLCEISTGCELLKQVKNRCMKTIITSVLLTTLKLSFLCFIFISVGLKLSAQDELKRTYLQLDYINESESSKNLKVNLRIKENRKFLPVKNATIGFYTGIDLDELMEEVQTDSKGNASIEVSEDIEVDSTGYFYFAAVFEGTDKFKKSEKDLSVKDSRLQLTFNQEPEGRSILVNAFEILSDEELPISEEDVVVSIPTLFGNMKIGDATLDEGSCTINFPSDLPGDSLGNLQIIAKIDDSDIYGNVVKTQMIPWGIPISQFQVEEVKMKGELWTHDAPLWMVVTLTILLLGVWSHFGYVIYKMYKINEEGSQKQVA